MGALHLPHSLFTQEPSSKPLIVSVFFLDVSLRI